MSMMHIDAPADTTTDDDDDADGAAAVDRGDALPGDDADADADAEAEAAAAKVATKPAAGEEEEEEEEDEEEDEDGKKLQNGPVRLNKMREQREKAREEAAQLRAELAAERAAKAPAPAKQAEEVDPAAEINTKLDALYEQVEEARLDGDAKLAASLQRQIDANNRALVTLEAEKISTRTTTAADENRRYDALLDQLEADIPYLNPKSDDFDPEAVKALEYYTTAHEKMDMAPAAALAAAARVVFSYGTKAAVAEEAPAATAEKLTKPTDVKKSLDTQKRQPPDPAARGVDKDDTTLDPDVLTDEEWDKLPASKKKAMRGDNG